MTSANAKLFAWQRLLGERERAVARLHSLSSQEADQATVASAHAELARLDREIAAVLVEVDELRGGRHATESCGRR